MKNKWSALSQQTAGHLTCYSPRMRCPQKTTPNTIQSQHRPACINAHKKTDTETSMYVGWQSGMQSSKDVKPTVGCVYRTRYNTSTKRPSETAQPAISQNVPLSQKDVQPSTVSLRKTHQNEFNKRPPQTSLPVLSQSLLKDPKEMKRLVVPARHACGNESHNNFLENRPAFDYRQLECPPQVRPKLMILSDKYNNDTQHSQSMSQKLEAAVYQETRGRFPLNERCQPLRERDNFKPLNFFDTKVEGSIYEDEWKKSLRPSLSDINLPVIPPEATLTLDFDILQTPDSVSVIYTELWIGEEKHKCVLKVFRSSRPDHKMMLNEAGIMHYLANTGAVPKVFGIVKINDQKYAIVHAFEFAGQNMCNLISKRSTSKKDWVTIFLNAAEALCKIHSKLVLINNIKPENILVDNNYNIQFIDMGMATLDRGMTYPWGSVVDGCGRLAPECRKGAESSFRSDIFRFGDVMKYIGQAANFPELTHLSTLLTCAQPFQRINIFDTIRRLKELRTAIEKHNLH